MPPDLPASCTSLWMTNGKGRMNDTTESQVDLGGPALVGWIHRLGRNPLAAYNAVKAVFSLSSDAVIHEILCFDTSVDSKLEVMNGKIDVLSGKIESLRWMIVVLIALLTLLAILGFFALVGRAKSVAGPCMQVASPQASVQPQQGSSAAGSVVATGDPSTVLSDERPVPSADSGESRDRLGAQHQQDLLK